MAPDALSSAVQTYAATLLAVGAMGALLLVQIVIADVIGIKRRHVPGSPVAGRSRRPFVPCVPHSGEQQ